MSHISCLFTPFPAVFSHRKRAGLVQFCAKCLGKMHEKRNKTAPKPVETYTNPTSFILSYTQTYTRKCLCLLGLSPCGVGNVGFFTKLFLKNVSALEVQEHRTSYVPMLLRMLRVRNSCNIVREFALCLEVEDEKISHLIPQK